MIQFTAEIIAKMLGGEVDGNSNAIVTTFAKIEEGTVNAISFLANPKYEQYLYDTQASVVLVNKDFVPSKKVNATLIRVDNAYSAIGFLLNKYNEMMSQKTGIEQPSFISESASVGQDVYIGAFAYIGLNVKIGDNVKIYPQVYIGDNVVIEDNSIIYAGVKIYHDCKIGKGNIIHSGAVIGSDGFGFSPSADGSYNKIAQIGNVETDDFVEIGANTTIDRATMGSTRIRKGVKLDNLIQIAHNVEVGQNTVIASQTGISGSTKIGSGCMIAGQVGFVGHLKIANNSHFGAQSGISRSITIEGQKWNGSPVDTHRSSLKSLAVYRRLPELEDKIRNIENSISELILKK